MLLGEVDCVVVVTDVVGVVEGVSVAVEETEDVIVLEGELVAVEVAVDVCVVVGVVRSHSSNVPSPYERIALFIVDTTDWQLLPPISIPPNAQTMVDVTSPREYSRTFNV